MNTFSKWTEIDLNECERTKEIRTKVTKCIHEKMTYFCGCTNKSHSPGYEIRPIIAVGKRSFRLEITLTAWNLSKTPRHRVAGKYSTRAPKNNSIIPRNPRIWSLKLSIKHNKESDFHALKADPPDTIFPYIQLSRVYMRSKCTRRYSCFDPLVNVVKRRFYSCQFIPYIKRTTLRKRPIACESGT